MKWERTFKIAKIDKEAQMVYGYASTGDLDSDGEIIKVEALEKALPDYLKFPTIREMHQPKAIGTTKEAVVDKKGLYVGAKIVSKEAWELVKEGVYKAFSIGGDVVKRAGNVIQELDLIEISLVDVPANKHATIEVWKRGKLSKDAETAYAMANLMIQVKDIISWYDYKGKDTKKLKKVLEIIKQILSVEANEPEGEKSEGIFEGKSAEELDAKIKALKSINFGNNNIANLLREGVILSMTKAKKLTKAEGDEEVQDENVESEETTAEDETLDSEETEGDESEETEEEDAEDEAEEAEEDTDSVESGELNASMKKLDSVNKTLEKMNPAKKDEPSKNLVKAISSMAGSLAKVAETLVSLEGRVAMLEKTPAATKSKSAVVMKQIGDTSNNASDSDTKKESGELTQKKARLAELNKIYDQIGKQEFAKRHSQEAARLMGEIEQLEKEKAGKTGK